MDDNPLAALTLIGAPALLTNATSALLLSTTNRFARALDRARKLASDIQASEANDREPTAFQVRQIGMAERRVLLLVRTLTAFYLAVGAFAASTLTALIGAVSFSVQGSLVVDLALPATLTTTGLGFAGLVFGAATLVWETHLASSMLREEADRILAPYAGRLGRRQGPGGPKA